MALRTLIVDDEPIARRVLREELESIEDVEIIGEAEDGAVALQEIAAQQPDLVLLDLQMPAVGGLDVIRCLKNGPHLPVIVIVTAYDKHALEALDAGAIDYLLKPVGQKRLFEAIERARHFTRRDAIERIAQLQEIYRSAFRAAGKENRRTGRRGILSAECGRDFRIPGRWGSGMDLYR